MGYGSLSTVRLRFFTSMIRFREDYLHSKGGAIAPQPLLVFYFHLFFPGQILIREAGIIGENSIELSRMEP